MALRRTVLTIGFVFILLGMLNMKVSGYSDMMFAYTLLGALSIPFVIFYSHFELGC